VILAPYISKHFDHSNIDNRRLSRLWSLLRTSGFHMTLLFFLCTTGANGEVGPLPVASIIQPGLITSEVPASPVQTGVYQQLYGELQALAEQEAGELMITLQSKSFFLSRDSFEADSSSEIGPGVWLDVLVQDADKLKVRISGWQQEGISRFIYALPGKRIISVTLDETTAGKVQHISSVLVTDTDQTWHEVTLEGWIKAGNLIADGEPLWAYASQIHNENCSTCHPLPVTEHLTANGWLGRLKAMKLNTNLQQEEYLVLLKFLQLNAADADTHLNNTVIHQLKEQTFNE